MKYLCVIAEGLADIPSSAGLFDDKTPLQLARTPNLDKMVADGTTGLCKLFSSSTYPASDTAFLAFMGNNPSYGLECRGYFEAKGLGMDIGEDETAFRVNLITHENDVLISSGCSSVSDDESAILFDALNKSFQDYPVRFYPVSGFRGGLIVKNDWLYGGKRKNLRTYNLEPDTKFILKEHYPKGNGRDKVVLLMEEASKVLSLHDINQVKIDLSENPANGIWLWSHHVPKKLKNFPFFDPAKSICVPGTHLARGIALCLKMESLPVQGAHGDAHQILSKRVEASMKAFEMFDFVCLHVETINDVSKIGDLHKKCQAIEYFDEAVVGKLLQFLTQEKEFRILVTSGQAVGFFTRNSIRMPVPWVLYGTGVKKDASLCFHERTNRSSYAGHKLLKKTLFKI